MISIFIALGGGLISLLTYILGKIVSEGEKALVEKRRVYEEFLRTCPGPNDVYEDHKRDIFEARFDNTLKLMPVVLFYSPANVVRAIDLYFKYLANAADTLAGMPMALQEEYKLAAKAHNDVILEMRRDALSWSAYGYWGVTRLPKAR